MQQGRTRAGRDCGARVRHRSFPVSPRGWPVLPTAGCSPRRTSRTRTSRCTPISRRIAVRLAHQRRS